MTNDHDTQHGISGWEERWRQKEREELHLAAAILHTEPYVCSYHGCAHHLTPAEQLYGDRCINHQQTIKFTHLINQVL